MRDPTAWQPAATAPRNREVLIWSGGRVYTALADLDGKWWGTVGGSPFYAGDGLGRLSLHPTHWRDMPEGPGLSPHRP